VTDTSSESWHKLLTEGHRPLAVSRHFFRHLPSSPRCKVCGNPFGGIGGRLCRVAGFSPSRKNPNLCTRCCDSLDPGGAEVDIAVLFADVRGSTELGERLGAGDFAKLLNRFYGAATDVLLRHDAIVDKLVGDQVVGLFIPGIAGPRYRSRAVEAAVELLRATGHNSAEGPWVPLGAGVNAGVAYVGNVGGEGVVDFTALGDAVNVASRLQANAADGELLVAEDVDGGVAAAFPGAGRRTLEIRGRSEPVTALVLSA
jgi:adenylate cyclase